MKTSQATVYVVDDDLSVRQAIRRLLESIGLRVEAYATAGEFLEAHDPDRPGCAVVDVRMPGMSGLDLQAELIARQVARPLVFVTAHADVPMSVRAMKGGAADFITKPFNEQVLLEAVHAALERDARQRAALTERAEIQSRAALLTSREREVLLRVVSGKLNKEIAAELGIAEKTVKVHRARVMEKMRAASLAELVVLSRVGELATPKAV